MNLQLISGTFIVFFIVAMALLFPKANKHKKLFLFVLNAAFYAFAGIEGMLIMAVFALVTYFGALLVQKTRSKCAFVCTLVLALVPLIFYKYAKFIMADVLNLGTQYIGFLSKLSVPLGISFFTFQGVGYLIDVYRGKCEAEKSFFNYIVFLSLFTCISSGPINRSQLLIEQIRNYNDTSFDYERCAEGFRYVLVGLFMKVFVASTLAMASAPSRDSGLALLFCSICFSVQIYCDFCGYSYIAFGLSKVLGLDVIQNFHKPYISKSLTEFWRRWHISLSSWLRDYVYISLGGSRCSKPRTYFNQIVTFAVSGIWHGANWTFVVWGLLNGIIIACEKLVGYCKESSSKLVNIIKHIVTLAIVNTLWIFFNAPTIRDALDTIKIIITKTVSNLISLRSMSAIRIFVSELGLKTNEFIQVGFAVIMYLVLELIMHRYDNPAEFFRHRSMVVRWVKYLVVIFIVLIFGLTGEAGEFIYANF